MTEKERPPVLIPKKAPRPPQVKKGFLRAPQGVGALPAGSCVVPLPSEEAAMAAAKPKDER